MDTTLQTRPGYPMKLLILIVALLLSLGVLAQSTALDGFIGTYAKEHHFNGSILIEQHGDIRYAKSFGLANIPFEVPNTQHTRYKIASITKLFTSVLILQLHEQGKLDLGKPIRTYLPDYAGEAGNKVSIQQLLNHTSGLPSFDGISDQATAIRDGIPVYQMPHTSDQLLTKYSSGPLISVPGKVFNYNNADYVVLGKIIEHLYGEPYEQVLKEKILRPLKMNDSGLLHQGDIINSLADTYFYRDDRKVLSNDLPAYPENWYAAGAMYSTTNDLMKFSNALFGLKLIKQATLDLLIKPGLDDYGYGLWSYDTTLKGKKHPVVKRPGAIMGAQSQFFHVLDQDITIIILGNTGATDSDAFVAEIAKRAVD
ncbi:serine hydrolase domain-containing protein [Rhodanobacter sp. MP7CTX1]|uniref:serine hydrolase n=1 Tax=Rhodanobacter sp. MP7CTX1 TaxID=2723084 RepID=UPI0016199F72|nr:CubicO group peptidase (beta-lactamase class C family) [Rhodanobacter sp. MP7CTX1]